MKYPGHLQREREREGREGREKEGREGRERGGRYIGERKERDGEGDLNSKLRHLCENLI